MAEARDGAPLGPALLLAALAQGALMLFVLWPHMFAQQGVAWLGFAGLGPVVWKVLGSLLFTGIVFVPALIFVANVLDRRAGFGLALQQDFAPAASTVFYARAASSLLALPCAALARASGFEAAVLEETQRNLAEFAARQGVSPEELRLMADQFALPESFAFTLTLPFFAVWVWVAARQAFRLSWARAAAAVVACGVMMVPLSAVLGPLFGWVLASPFLLLVFLLLTRGYLGGVMRAHRARAAFRQNLEAATLNPADATAHYHLGLVHLQRREPEEARARFARAVEIDPDETDAHYQLGRLARAAGQFAEAIKHFGEVVSRDDAHAQHEVWREVGATYLAAGQFGDARDALERFLARRPSDPEGLYLMGRAHSGLGRAGEAREWMQRCVEAVRTAPAYKYRADQRWLDEAQQFLRTQA
ncbi:MAG: tetratricopeptide repeat protein, partial [Acidobacteriota bacterium]|nr:tetratricopeptide repeat protein [Acidobacteriota bacterium]